MSKFIFTFKNKSTDDIKNFVNEATKVDGDVVVTSGKNHFDGRSLLGMLALKDCDILLVMYPAEAKDFEDYLTSNYVPRLPRLFNYI
jgi:hypothetical protein